VPTIRLGQDLPEPKYCVTKGVPVRVLDMGKDLEHIYVVRTGHFGTKLYNDQRNA
jgi:hypothetical protein